METVSPKARFQRNLTWSVFDQFTALALGVLSLSILVKFIQVSDIGLLGLAFSFMSVAKFADIGVSSIFLREDTDIEHRNRRLSAFYFFASVRLIVLVSLVSLLVITTASDFSLKLLAVSVVFAVSIGLAGITVPPIEYVFSQYRQLDIAKLKLVLRLVHLGAFSALLVWPNIFLYLAIPIAITLIEVIFWWFYLRTMGFRVSGGLRSWVDEIRSVIADFSLWVHFIGVGLNLMYWIDLFILQYFVTIDVLGDYTIALRMGNFLFMFPVVFEKNVILVLSRERDVSRRTDIFNFFMKGNLILSLAIFAAAVVSVPLYFNFVLRLPDARMEQTMALFIPLALAVTLRNIARPCDALVVQGKYLRPFLWRGVLPLVPVALLAYTLGAWFAGAEGVAWANILVFGLFLAFVVIYIKKVGLINRYTIRPSSQESLYIRSGLRVVASLLGLGKRST